MEIHALVFASKGSLGKISRKNLEMLQTSAEKLGHKVVPIYNNECQMKFGNKPNILIRNH